MTTPHKLFTIAALALTITLAQPPAARADYMMPEVEVGFSEITAIIDATVESFDDRGRALLTVHEVIYGDQTPTTIDDVSLTCMGGSIERYGVVANTRYIFFLRENKMYEEKSFFPVTASADNTQVTVDVQKYYQKWLRLPSAKIGRGALIESLRAHLAAKRPRALR